MYAVIEISGKQFRVAEKDVWQVPKQSVPVGSALVFDNVLLIQADKQVHIGTPYVKGASVHAELIQNKKTDKVVVFKKKRRKGYAVKKGHRQMEAVVKIKKIDWTSKKVTSPADTEQGAPEKKNSPKSNT